MIGSRADPGDYRHSIQNQQDAGVARFLQIQTAMNPATFWAAIALENARLYEKEREANRTKEEFLATLSHELRTPLSAILGYARLLKTGKLDAGAAERALQSLHRNAELQSQLVTDLIDVSRIMRGKLKLNMTSLNLSDVVQASLNSVQIQADAKSIYMQFKCEEGAVTVFGDADRLQQVISNLITNSIKFTPEGGCITVRLSSTESHAEIKVSDNGIGLSPEFLPRVFEKFTQADTSLSRQNTGLGLGLAIVQHLVKTHGGTVQADSRGIGCGATFTVRLPLRTMAFQKAG
jgi:signal transduction histidine kinase